MVLFDNQAIDYFRLLKNGIMKYMVGCGGIAMELSKKERLMLINQYRILSILNPDGASSYNVRIKMLENGYSLHYDEMISWLDDGMSQEQCQEIIDILEMYRCLWHSYKKLRDKKGISKKDVRFPGFDAKEEERELNYAEFVMYSLKRYKEFHQRKRIPNHDSYKVMMGQYRAMLSVWKSLGYKKLLTRDEIIQILNGERVVPDIDDIDDLKVQPEHLESLPVGEGSHLDTREWREDDLDGEEVAFGQYEACAADDGPEPDDGNGNMENACD